MPSRLLLPQLGLASALYLLVAMPAHAVSVEEERRELIALNDQLTKLEFLVQRAERQADYRSPRQMDYDALRSDLRDIQAGIEAYLYPSRPQPLPVKPLSGDYTVRSHEQ